jgi:Holin of 3TMs, for gene-transfer release
MGYYCASDVPNAQFSLKARCFDLVDAMLETVAETRRLTWSSSNIASPCNLLQRNSSMSILAGLIGPVAGLIDKIIPDPQARDRAKLELLRLEGSQEMETLRTQLSAIVAEAQSTDPWTSRARPSFLYVMYALLLWAIPMGLLSAFRPDMARGVAEGMNAYLAGIPEPLYALFGTGYLGYTAARTWGKIRGVEG